MISRILQLISQTQDVDDIIGTVEFVLVVGATVVPHQVRAHVVPLFNYQQFEQDENAVHDKIVEQRESTPQKRQLHRIVEKVQLNSVNRVPATWTRDSLFIRVLNCYSSC